MHSRIRRKPAANLNYAPRAGAAILALLKKKAGDALKFSISKWGQLAQGLYGNQFANWEFAKERKIECEHYDEPALNGRISCVAIALPCEKR